MVKINISNEPKQKITIPFEDTSIVFDFVYRPAIQCWIMDIRFRDEIILQGRRLTLSTELVKQLNVPFEIILKENQNTGLDPFLKDDFISRVSFYLLNREEARELRGYDVP